jgi:hypothetical protein
MRFLRSHPTGRSLRPLALLLSAGLVASVGMLGTPAAAQSSTCDCQDRDDWGYRQHLHRQSARPASTEVGQDALGAIQEVVGLLLADPATDWSTISIARVRQYVVDLDLMTLFAQVEEVPIEGGLRVRLSGDQEILAAARRAVLRHASRMDGFRGWSVSSEDLGDAIVVELSAAEEAEVAVLRGLGFYGFLASGVHRPHQLLAVARGVGD